MDKTLFVTGYVGLVLAIFNFFPLNFKNLYWINVEEVHQKLFIYVVIVIASVSGCIILVMCYDLLLKRFENNERILKIIKIIAMVAFMVIVCIFYYYIHYIKL